MVVSKSVIRRAIAATVAASAVVVSPLFFSATSRAAVTLNGAGASFPAPLYERYIAALKDQGLTVNYQSCGSSCGIRQVTAGTVDFGGSDAAMTDDQIAEVNRGVILVPTAGGAVSVVYNLPGVSGLKLSRKTLPGIFSGEIKKWNDPQIQADNPGVNLPNTDIRLVVRADGSGTTFIFTNHLSAVSPYFKGRVGTGTRPNWAGNPLRGRGNPGVAAQVSRTSNSIGYVEFAYAKQNNLQMASIQNKKGEFVMPSLEASKEALSNVQFPENFRVFEGDPAGGYPIVGLTWMMVYKQYESAEKAEAVKKMIRWVLTEGQKINPTLDYVSIPDEVAQRAISVVESEVKP